MFLTIRILPTEPTPTVVVDVVEGLPTLEQLQEVVGGLIEPVFTIPSPLTKNHLTGYVNEEGLLLELPRRIGVNNSMYSGNLVVCGLDMVTGETVELTMEEISYLQENIFQTRGQAVLNVEE